MSVLTFFYPVLERLGDGGVARKSVALVLRALGVLIVLRALAFDVGVLKQGFSPAVSTEVTLAAMLVALLVLAGAACGGEICFYRARSVARMGDSPFTMIPVVSVLLRWAGEVCAAMLVTFAASGCLMVWISNTNPPWLLGDWPATFVPATPGITSAFLLGFVWLGSLAAAAFVALVLAYFLAEVALAVAGMAQDLRLLAAGPARKSAAAAPAAAAPPVAPAGTVLLCRACGSPLEPGAAVCGSCGSHA